MNLTELSIGKLNVIIVLKLFFDLSEICIWPCGCLMNSEHVSGTTQMFLSKSITS